MATLLKLLLFGCICLSACTQQNRGVRSADELFKELESAYQRKDSVAFEKFFKEWNEISKDSMQVQKFTNDTVQEIYNIANELLNPSTKFYKDRRNGILYKSRYGVIQTNISYSIKDTAGNIFKSDTLYNFYPQSRKSRDSVLLNFPQYKQSILRFMSEIYYNDKVGNFKKKQWTLSPWTFYDRYYSLLPEIIYNIEFSQDMKNARVLFAEGNLDVVHLKTLKKENNRWIEISDEGYNPFIEGDIKDLEEE